MMDTWEDLISINSQRTLDTTPLGPIGGYLHQDDGQVAWDTELYPYQAAVERDPFPLPATADREGYYGDNHFHYWASGLRDLSQMARWARAHGQELGSLLDIGCASGRLLRHMRLQLGASTVLGCDINRLHVDWCCRHLPPGIGVFQNTAVPHLPLPDASLDLVSAFSIFTHVESFDTTWLMEIRRILKPGGVAWLTVHSERTWRELAPDWPLHPAVTSHPDYAAYRGAKELPRERLVFRWERNRSYSANVFYSESYIANVWGRIMPVVDWFPALPPYQDIVVLRAPGEGLLPSG